MNADMNTAKGSARHRSHDNAIAATTFNAETAEPRRRNDLECLNVWSLGATSRRGHNDRPMPSPHQYRGRRAAVIEDDDVRVTVLEEERPHRGDLRQAIGRQPVVDAAVALDRTVGVHPGASRRVRHRRVDAQLLAGLMGHNLCVDIFGGPSAEEAAAGLTPHGEASIARYETGVAGRTMTLAAELPLAALRVEREIEILGRALRIRERIDNLSGCDRPIGWTQHVTLGPPLPRERGHRVPRLGDAVESLRACVRARRLPRPGRGVRLAAGAPCRRWRCRPAAVHGRRQVQRLHRPPDGHLRSTMRFLSPSRRGCASHSATSGPDAIFPGWESGRKTTAASTLRGTGDADARDGVRRLADAGVAARDDRTRPPVRGADLPVDSREEPRRGRCSGPSFVKPPRYLTLLRRP